LVLVAGYIVTSVFSAGFYFSEVALLSPLFAIIVLISLIIFFRGQSKNPESQTMHSLVAVGLKFLLELFLVFIWFILAKKTGLSSVLLFFVLYLAFTLFLIFVMLKTLKTKSL
jgi:Ca2+/Na+ antiporter